MSEFVWVASPGMTMWGPGRQNLTALGMGACFRADDPLVLERPDLFSASPPEVMNSAGIVTRLPMVPVAQPVRKVAYTPAADVQFVPAPAVPELAEEEAEPVRPAGLTTADLPAPVKRGPGRPRRG